MTWVLVGLFVWVLWLLWSGRKNSPRNLRVQQMIDDMQREARLGDSDNDGHRD